MATVGKPMVVEDVEQRALENLKIFLLRCGRMDTGETARMHPNMIDDWRTEYAQAFPTDKPFVDAGVDPVPLDWVNKKA